MTRTLRISARPLDRPPLAPGRGRTSPRRRRSRAWLVESLEGRTLLNAGDLDLTFGNGGLVTTDFASGPDHASDASSVVVQADGKIVAAGRYLGPGGGFALARYDADGSLDPSFGQGGLVITSFGSGISALAVQADGKLVAVGEVNISPGVAFALARYNQDGSLDQSFGQNGLVTTRFTGDSYNRAFSLIIQSDGKIVAAGASQSNPTSTRQDFALARYDADGSLDQSFGTGGLVTTDFGATQDEVAALALQPDGKIVAAGTKSTFLRENFALARYNADGSLDTSFGQGGKVTTDFGGWMEHASSLVVQPDGRLVAAGYNYGDNTGEDFALARYNADGSLDTSFGQGGKVTTDFNGRSGDVANALVVQPDGKLVAAGWTNRNSSESPYDFALARYDADGRLDPSFGQGGLVTTGFASGDRGGEDRDVANSLALQSDGKIVAAGTDYSPTTSLSFALARYEGDSAPQGNPPTADAGGPYAIREGDPLHLDAAASGDPDGDPLTYAWDVNGDGNFTDAAGVLPTLTWARLQSLGITDSGNYSVKVRVYDGHGHVVTSPAASLSIANTAPTAAITGAPATSPEGGAIVLTASVSDPSNADTKAGFADAWTVTKNGAPYATGSGPSLTLTPDDDGTYVVHLAATDRDGDSGTDSRTIAVTDVAPTATLTNDGPADTGAPVSVRFANPFDPSGADTAAGLHFAFATSAAALASATYASSGTAASTSFTFGTAGNYTIYGSILDKDGGHSDYSTDITITHVVAPEVIQTVVNQGQDQRSNVESISVRLNRNTNLPALIADGTITRAVQVVGPAGALDLAANRYRYDASTLTLAVDLTIDGLGGSLQTMLADGRYQLRLDPSLITAPSDPTNTLVDNDGTADGVVRHDFLRLLGDFTGDGLVSLADRAPLLAHFGTAAGQPGYDYGFDLNGDGVINVADYVLWTRRLGQRIAPQGNPPTADAGGPYAIHEGDPLRLDAAASSDPDGDVLTYAWDLNGDGTFSDAAGVQPTLSWAQLQALGITDSGSYSVKVRVDDGHGHVVTSPAVGLQIDNTAPTATLSNNGPAEAGLPVTVRFANPFDPSGADTASGFHYAFATDPAVLAAATYATSGAATSASFTFAAVGNYTVYGRVLDKDDGYSDYPTTVVVTAPNHSPTADAGGPYTIREGDSLTLSASASSDPDGDPLTYSWDVNGDGIFGDATGVQPTLSWTQLQALGVDDGPAPFPVRVRVDDGRGGFTETLEVSALIDGRDQLIVHGDTIQWQHFENAAVGRHSGLNMPTVLTTTLNGQIRMDHVDWIPTWPLPPPDEIRFPALSSTFTITPALPMQDMTVTLTTIQARSSLHIVQLPSTGNGFTTVLEFDDNNVGSDAIYDGLLTFTTGSGPSETGRTVSAPVSLQVDNTAPTATLSNTGPVGAGTSVPVTVRFTDPFDPSNADTASGFHYAFATDPAALADATYANSGTATSASYTFDTAGTHTVYGRILDKDGGHSDYSTAITVSHVAPEVVQTVVNQGQAQRSNVESISVRLNRTTNLPALIADGTIARAAQVVGPAGALDLAADRYHYDALTLTLAVDLTIDGFGGSLKTMLADGKYQLRLDPSLITAPDDPANPLLDNDGTSDGVVRYDFFRLLGDFTGDGLVSLADRTPLLAHFGTVAGQSGYDYGFDLNGDGAINVADYILWTRRLGQKL